jgi:predicted outer membrane repeat protein
LFGREPGCLRRRIWINIGPGGLAEPKGEHPVKAFIGRRRQWAIVFVMGGVLAGGTGVVQGGTIHVSTSGNDANDGLTWPTAKRTVQAGLNTAVAGDQVWAAAGTYVERITLKNGVTLYGGFVSGETDMAQRNWVVNRTILDGNQGGSVVTASSGTTSTARIDGFTIRNGKATWGGGIYCQNAAPMIANNTITGNNASSDGGGIYCTFFSGATIANNLIAGNSASSAGGIYCSNSAATIIGNAILGNVANSASAKGAGIYCQGSLNPTITNNTIAYNSVTDTYSADGGGIYCDSSCSATITNTSVAFNSSGIYKASGSGSPVLRYNCVYGNVEYNYSGLADPTGTNGNISADPNLADLPYRNCHVQALSPCRDAGDDSVVQAGWKDIDGQARILGSHVDIGADESDGTTWSGLPDMVVRVAPEGNDANDGSSWPLAKRTVQAAIEAASASAGDVWVKAGTYPERVTLRSFVHVYGGFAGTETQRTARDWAARVTILDGSQGGSVVTARALARGASTIDGFTLRNGNGTLSSSYRYGGGVYCSWAAPTITNNTITANSASKGGGIYCEYLGASIANNAITTNNATSDGGGVYCYLAPATLMGNTITRNTANTYGGGIHCDSCSGTLITGNTINANVGYLGAAVYCYSGTPTIANNMIASNTGSYRGAIYCSYSSAIIRNNIITGNSDSGIDCGSASPTITNNTIIGNGESGIYSNSGSPVITNTLIAFNSSGISIAGGAATLRYNCLYGNPAFNYSGVADPTGTDGNLIANPRLADASMGSPHIEPGSPCIDAGDDAVIQAGWKDIDGQSRKIGAHVDIGADESDGTTWPCGTAAAVRVTPEGNDANNGSSWVLAKRTVQAAIDAAAASGGQVWVKEGTYLERITLRNFVHVYGGFAGTETQRSDRSWPAHPTILDGGQGGSVVTATQLGYGVSSIDGFVIRNGSGTISSSYVRCGGGIYCSYASPTISHNKIIGNTVTGNYASGGGIYCEYASPIITANIVVGNSAVQGGGIHCDAYAYPVVAGNTISRNVVAGTSPKGGGIYCDSHSAPIIAGTILAFNSSGIYSNAATPSLRYNCTYGNTAYNFSGLTDPTGTNGNISADPQFVRPPSPGADNKWGTADDNYGDLHLLPGSRCIDAGSTTDVPTDLADLNGNGDAAEPLPFDLAGAGRFADDPYMPDTGLGTAPIVDMGAYEHRLADANGDGYVDVVDLLGLVYAFGTLAGDPAYDATCDFNHDGAVDVVDLLDLVYNFGT